jgi:hypothetical protein
VNSSALGLGNRLVVRVHAAERDQHAVGGRGCLEHHVVGGGVAVGLVHREHERASGARELQRREQLLGRVPHPVGIVLAEVRVHVEQLEPGDLVPDDVSPRLQQGTKLHPWIRTMKRPCPGH